VHRSLCLVSVYSSYFFIAGCLTDWSVEIQLAFLMNLILSLFVKLILNLSQDVSSLKLNAAVNNVVSNLTGGLIVVGRTHHISGLLLSSAVESVISVGILGVQFCGSDHCCFFFFFLLIVN